MATVDGQIEALVATATRHIETKNFEACHRNLQVLLERAPENVSVQIVHLNFLLATQPPFAVAEKTREYMRKNVHPTFVIILYKCLCLNEQPMDALKILEGFIEKYPTSLPVLEFIVDVYCERSMIDMAMEAQKNVLAMCGEPEKPENLKRLAKIFLRSSLVDRHKNAFIHLSRLEILCRNDDQRLLAQYMQFLLLNDWIKQMETDNNPTDEYIDVSAMLLVISDRLENNVKLTVNFQQNHVHIEWETYLRRRFGNVLE
ncbi:hypothetical protein PCE1_004068 [Barthelona sp. PCE]